MFSSLVKDVAFNVGICFRMRISSTVFSYFLLVSIEGRTYSKKQKRNEFCQVSHVDLNVQ